MEEIRSEKRLLEFQVVKRLKQHMTLCKAHTTSLLHQHSHLRLRRHFLALKPQTSSLRKAFLLLKLNHHSNYLLSQQQNLDKLTEL